MAIDMTKRAETALVSLQKMVDAAPVDLGELSAQMVLVIDYSGSMTNFYATGEVQELTERMLGLAKSGLDDDGQVPIYPFQSYALEPFTVDVSNYSNVIQTWRDGGQIGQPTKRGLFRKPPRRTEKPRMGGTNYAPVIHKVVEDLRAAGDLDPTQPPVLVLFQTDGGPEDRNQTEAALKLYSDLPIFWQFVGLGRHTSFLSVLDNLPGRKVDNVGTCGWPSIKAVSDEVFYDGIISEFFPKWLPAARAAGITKK